MKTATAATAPISATDGLDGGRYNLTLARIAGPPGVTIRVPGRSMQPQLTGAD